MQLTRPYSSVFFVAMALFSSPALSKLIQISDAIYLGAGFQASNAQFEQGRSYELVSPRNLYTEVWENASDLYAGSILDQHEWSNFEDHLVSNRENWHETGEYVLKLEAVEILFWDLLADDDSVFGAYEKGRFIFGDRVYDKTVAGTESRFIFNERDVLDYFVDQSNSGSELSFAYVSTEGDASFQGSHRFFETQFHIDIYRRAYEVSEPRYIVWSFLTSLLLLIWLKVIRESPRRREDPDPATL